MTASSLAGISPFFTNRARDAAARWAAGFEIRDPSGYVLFFGRPNGSRA